MSLLLAYSWLSLVLDMTQMALDVRKNWKPAQFIILDNFCFNNFSNNQSLGMSLLLAYSWLSLVLHMTQMALDVQKNRKPAQFFITDNFYFNNFSKLSIPGDILNLGLLLAASGPGHDPDGPG